MGGKHNVAKVIDCGGARCAKCRAGHIGKRLPFQHNRQKLAACDFEDAFASQICRWINEVGVKG